MADIVVFVLLAVIAKGQDRGPALVARVGHGHERATVVVKRRVSLMDHGYLRRESQGGLAAGGELSAALRGSLDEAASQG